MLGNLSITLALLAGVFTVIMYYFTYKGYENTLKLARAGYHVMAIGVIVASVLLIHAILTHNYEYKYVFNYSGSGLPTGLLISTFYAGQEGSFMLWLLFSSIVGLILLEYTSRRGDLENRVMFVYSLSVTFLLLMVSPMLKNPFSFIWSEPTFIDVKNINQSFLSMPFLKNFLFEDNSSNQSFVQMNSQLVSVLKGSGISIKEFIIQGKGLNPLLQNFWMQIHPPILFVGFSMSAVPFAFAAAALMKNDYKDWIRQAFPWVLTGTMVLGLAIMLGGYWAYGVLGWGGYWGWDPVENSSLIPWIIGLASVHTFLIQRKTQSKGGVGRFVKTNLILAMLTYILVLYSTFLTRSGILGDASVHSFVAPGMVVYLFLIIFMVTFLTIGAGGLAYRWKYLNDNFTGEESVLSRELALFTGAVALIASAIIIFVGTSAPIFGQAVETRFYNELNLPIAIIIGLLNGFSLLLKWKSSQGKDIIKNSKFSISATIISTVLIVTIGKVYDFMLIILALSSAFTLFVNLEIAYKIFLGRKTHIGAYIAHIGIALFLLGVISTGGFSKEKTLDLIKGESVEAFGYNLTFTGYEPIDNGKKYSFNIELNDGNSSSIVSPVMYIAEFNNSLMREPDILNMFTKDFYISPVSYSDGGGHDHGSGSEITLKKGESYQFNGSNIIFSGFNFQQNAMDAMMAGGDFFIGANLIVEQGGNKFDVEPKLTVTQGNRTYVPVSLSEANLKIEMTKLDAAGSIELILSSLDGSGESNSFEQKEVLSIEASIKPFINLVWTGVLVMVFGFIISVIRRSKESLK